MDAATQHPALREAAAIAHVFHLDPVLVIAEPDPLKALVRRAAALVVHAETERAEKAARRTR